MVWHARGVRILVVEDEPSLRDGIVDLLTGDGHQVTAVGEVPAATVEAIAAGVTKEGMATPLAREPGSPPSR